MDITKLKQRHKIEEEDVPWDDEIVTSNTESNKLAPIPAGYEGHIILEDGSEIINGKKYLPHQFRPGNREFEKRKPGTPDKVVIKRMLQATTLRSFRHCIATVGVERLMQELDQLEGKDYISAFVAIAPYALPKIAAVDFKSGEVEAIPLEGKVHTITIKDFRTGVTTIINDD